MTTETEPTCPRHPGVETLLSCTRCGAPACPDCLVTSAVGSHCIDCVRGQRRERTVAARAESRLFRPGPVFYLLVAAFAGACGWAAATPITTVGPSIGDRIAPILVVILGWIVSLCIHEWAHAAVAYRGGDRTVAEKGYLTLDPRHYADPIWSVAMPIAFLILGGLGLPGGAVWIERHRIRSRRVQSLVSLAGPATNIVFGVAVLAVVRSGMVDGSPVLRFALAYLGLLEFATALLNLIPIPGLDGYGAIEPYLPHGVRMMLRPIAQYGIIVLFFVFVSTDAGNWLWDAARWGTGLMGVDDVTVALGQVLTDLDLT
ncbi:MAG: site-2 protease family protein [Thermoleophilia bacterium]|nr:site-2 protease family protein [Thermoleophilia bacterium]